LKIPRDRIAVLIGKKGKIKKEVETATKTKLKIDSREGDVDISGKDAINLYNAREVIKAIGRGFNPDVAILLLKQDYVLEIINIEDFARTTNIKRVKGRLIGTKGKARKTIETLTECYISVYGKTVSIVGSAENVVLARRAIEGLLRGAKHANIYKWLERRRKEIIQEEMLGGSESG
jgi:ribosomal RNA assembly protein